MCYFKVQNCLKSYPKDLFKIKGIILIPNFAIIIIVVVRDYYYTSNHLYQIEGILHSHFIITNITTSYFPYYYYCH